MDNPFELNKVNRQVRKNSKKYLLTLVTEKKVSKNILMIFKWSHILLMNNKSINADDFKLTPDLKRMYHTVRYYHDPNTTNCHFNSNENIRALWLCSNKNLTCEGYLSCKFCDCKLDYFGGVCV